MRPLSPLILILVLQFGSAQGSFGSGNWELLRIGDTAVTVQNKPTISFGSKRVSVFLGCNKASGPYSLKPGSLKIGPLISTKKSCGARLDQLEHQYAAALEKVMGYSFSADGGNTLYMGLNGPGILLRFTPKP
jgi:heat shock protein HslJ